jgi:hypothetical protein
MENLHNSAKIGSATKAWELWFEGTDPREPIGRFACIG